MYENMQGVKTAFQSILRADYVSISDIQQLDELDEYYVDFFKNLSKVLQFQDSYINGRRGTGKTTLLMRAYYECLKTISSRVKKTSTILAEKKVLPIYIDLSQCKDMFEMDDNSSLERTFIFRLISSFKDQLKVIFEEDKFNFLKKDYSMISTFEDLDDFVKEGILLKTKKKNMHEELVSTSKRDARLNVSIENPALAASVSNSMTKKSTHAIEEFRQCNVQLFLSYLGQIRISSKIDAIYVFIDEYSDLTDDEQNKFSILLKKLLGSKNNIFFKVGTITDRYDFGEKIIVGRDIYPISLDLNDFVERYKGITSAFKELLIFTKELIQKRLSIFAENILYDDIFPRDSSEEILLRITRESMGVPRTIGLILQNALLQAEIKNNRMIQVSDINIGIRETRKIYFKQFQGAVQKRVIPGFYMDMWNSLLKKALDEKNKNTDRPASHFMIDPSRKKYLNIFCENFIIHCLEESRASKYGGNYILYSFDYDVCNENNIIYAMDKDEFTAIRFIYDNVLQKYDCYFTKDKLKSYKCKSCNRLYEESEVACQRVKRCFECDEKLEEIIHKTVPVTDGNYTEIEVKILGMIATLDQADAMSAAEIGEKVGCSYQKVANWCSKVLVKKGFIDIIKKDDRNYYFDKSNEV